MSDQPYSFPQSPRYEVTAAGSAYFSGGSVFPSYAQMQSSARYSRQTRSYPTQTGNFNYCA